MQVKIEPSWKKVLSREFDKVYFVKLTEFVRSQYQKSTVYPPPKFIFRAFDLTPFEAVKVIVLGQDPYHGEGQANGLAFAVEPGTRLPPSLQNIYKELKSDLGVGGDINNWAGQGVLLLNATLTVQANSPASHQNMGWEQFTDAVISMISEKKEHVVFLLWGDYAKKKGKKIDQKKHCVLTSGHPSPLSANRGYWFGNKHFSKTNNYMKNNNLSLVKW